MGEQPKLHQASHISSSLKATLPRWILSETPESYKREREIIRHGYYGTLARRHCICVSAIVGLRFNQVFEESCQNMPVQAQTDTERNQHEARDHGTGQYSTEKNNSNIGRSRIAKRAADYFEFIPNVWAVAPLQHAAQPSYIQAIALVLSNALGIADGHACGHCHLLSFPGRRRIRTTGLNRPAMIHDH